MTFDELTQSRRSIRAYLPDRPVDRSTVDEIMKAAQQAPSWKNSQTGRCYAVCSPEKVAEIRETCLPAFNQKNSRNAGALLVTTYVRGNAGFTAGEPVNELGDKWGAYDLGLQNAYLILKARDLGLDTLIMGMRDADLLREKLSIPDEEEIVSVIALGYRDGEPAVRPRFELDKVVKYF